MRPGVFVAPGGARLELWPQRAAFDPSLGLLCIADAHFGKTHTFRRHGLAVPQASEQAMIDRFEDLVQQTQPRCVAFLGDLLHGPWSQECEAVAVLEALRSRHAHCAWHLIVGNHDRHAGLPPERLLLDIHAQSWRVGPWELRHEPPEPPASPGPPASAWTPYTLAGHVHPGVRLPLPGGQTVRMPCFDMGPTVGVLPAFGAFTGLQNIPVSGNHQVFAVLESEGAVLPLHAGTSSPRRRGRRVAPMP